MRPHRIECCLPGCRLVGRWTPRKTAFTLSIRAIRRPPRKRRELFRGGRLADLRDRAVPVQVLLLREQFARVVAFFSRGVGVLPLGFGQEVFFGHPRHGGGRKKGGPADRGDHQPELSMTTGPAIHGR